VNVGIPYAPGGCTPGRNRDTTCDAHAMAPSPSPSMNIGRPAAGPANEPAGPASRRFRVASGPVDHQGNRVIARIDDDDLPASDQKPKLIQLRRSIQHDLRKIVELYVIGYFCAKC